MTQINSNLSRSTKHSFNFLPFIKLQAVLFILSFGAVFSKLAGRQKIFSLLFFLFYGILIFILFVYAVVWQQVLKQLSLNVAYACKGIGIFYSILWGVLFFDETISFNMVLGALFVLIGVFIHLFEEIKEKNG